MLIGINRYNIHAVEIEVVTKINVYKMLEPDFADTLRPDVWTFQ